MTVSEPGGIAPDFRRVEQKIVKALATLVRCGRVADSGEDHYLARRSA